MSRLNEKEFIQRVKDNQIDNLYLLYGNEKYLIRLYAKSLSVKLTGGPNAGFNSSTFDFEDDKLEELDQQLQALPVFAERKCVHLKGFNAEKATKKQLEQLESYFQTLPPSTVFVMTEMQRDVNYAKSDKWKKFIQLVDRYGCVVEFPKRDRRSLEKFICDRAKKRGVILSKEQADDLIDHCSDEIDVLCGEADKLISFTNEGLVSDTAMGLLVIRRMEATVFALADDIIRRNAKQAYQKLAVLFDQKEEPVAILNVLGGAFIDLYRAKAAELSGVTSPQAAEDFAYRALSFKIRNAFRSASGEQISFLRGAVGRLREADRMMKSTALDPQRLLEQTIGELLAAR